MGCGAWARVVLAALEARAELPARHQEVHVVRAHEVLRHAHDRALERGLAVVVGRLLRHVADELRDLHVVRELALERAEQHLGKHGEQVSNH